jgi:hypothetical protein
LVLRRLSRDFEKTLLIIAATGALRSCWHFADARSLANILDELVNLRQLRQAYRLFDVFEITENLVPISESSSCVGTKPKR